MGTVSAGVEASRGRETLRGRTIQWAVALAFVAQATAVLGAIDLSPAERARVGKRVWQNECGGTVSGLTSWNAGENFASLGIGHFIWYPAGARGPFEESLPDFVEFAATRGRPLPELLRADRSSGCPWKSRAEFESQIHSPKTEQLRQFLASTVDLQAEFLVRRLQAALPKMTAGATATDRARIERNFDCVASTAAGCYALVDFVNFKGEGVLPTERYAGAGWGLRQVLEGMQGEGTGRDAVREFSASAKAVLQRRVKNAPPARNESRWLAGWLARVATYPQ